MVNNFRKIIKITNIEIKQSYLGSSSELLADFYFILPDLTLRKLEKYS